MQHGETEEHLLPLRPDTPETEDAIDNMIERFSLVFERFGFQRMAGRIFALMLLSEEPMVTQAQLAEYLKASTGSISTMIRLLEQLGFVERVSVPGHRSDRFRLTEDPLVEMTVRRLEGGRQVIEIIRETRRSHAIGPKADERLALAEDFYVFFMEYMSTAFDEWREHRESSTK